jgi:DNA-binding CsgD family transcriptional regulator
MILVRELLRTYTRCDAHTRMDIDLAVRELHRRGILSNREKEIISLLEKRYSMKDISIECKVGKNTVQRDVNNACEKIAIFLGSDYQDDKIIDMVARNLGRELTLEEKLFCRCKLNDAARSSNIHKINIYNFKMVDGKVVLDEQRGNKDKG